MTCRAQRSGLGDGVAIGWAAGEGVVKWEVGSVSCAVVVVVVVVAVVVAVAVVVEGRVRRGRRAERNAGVSRGGVHLVEMVVEGVRGAVRGAASRVGVSQGATREWARVAAVETARRDGSDRRGFGGERASGG
jgi:hypothetical protein